MPNIRHFAIATLTIAAALSCAAKDAGKQEQQPSRATLFSTAVKNVSIEIDYAEGAEPYTGAQGRLADVFQLFELNATRLFAQSPKTLTVQRTLAEMEKLADVSGSDFTRDQVLAIAEKHRTQKSTSDTVTFYVVWLDGHLRDDSGVRDDVLGVSFGDTGVIAMFKPTIASSSSAATPGIAKFVEQSTLVHEFGHAIGLVNNGVPLSAAHQDAEHGAHCSNDKCVMYYANEGAAAAVAFVKRYVATGNELLFAPDCLADVDAFAANPK
jgi:predicted Zn-dependent protease